MAESMLDNYNPLYDVHLRQYFALPHMQRHLRKMGLLQDVEGKGDEVYKRHQAMMEMIIKNREVQLMKMAELRRKLDAAEKVETCRRIRSGLSPESYRRTPTKKASRSLSRGRRNSGNERQRRFSNSYDDKEILTQIEQEYTEPIDHSSPRDAYKRLSANVKKYNYLHKMDDPTLINYKDTLKKQLDRLERFREVTFGIHSVVRQPPPVQTSWFFRRRSINNLRGRKHSPQTKLSQSHDNRTSCPPTMRKRKDSNPRFPPIPNKSKSAKSPAKKVSQTPITRLPPAAQRPPSSSRGRSETKKETRTSVTRTTTTNTVTKSNALPIIGAAAIGGAAAAISAISRPSVSSPQKQIPNEPQAQSPRVSEKSAPIATSPVQLTSNSPVVEKSGTDEATSGQNQSSLPSSPEPIHRREEVSLDDSRMSPKILDEAPYTETSVPHSPIQNSDSPVPTQEHILVSKNIEDVEEVHHLAQAAESPVVEEAHADDYHADSEIDDRVRADFNRPVQHSDESDDSEPEYAEEDQLPEETREQSVVEETFEQRTYAPAAEAINSHHSVPQSPLSDHGFQKSTSESPAAYSPVGQATSHVIHQYEETVATHITGGNESPVHHQDAEVHQSPRPGQESPLPSYVSEVSTHEHAGYDHSEAAHESPAPVQRSPVPARESPAFSQASPVPAHESSVHDHASPVPVHESPAFAQTSPVPAQESPAFAQASPVPAHESPVQNQASPAPAHESPAPAHESPAFVQSSPVPAHESPDQDQASPVPAHHSPAPVQYSPAPTHESSVHDHASPVPVHESPAFAQASPVPAHESPIQNQASTAPAHESPAPAHESPAFAQASPVPAHESPAFSQASPVPAHESPAPVQYSPVPAHESPAFSQASPVPAHESPAPVQYSPVPAHESPAHDQASPIPAHESPAPVQYSPVQAHETPVHDHTSSVPANESPVFAQYSPVPAHESPAPVQYSAVPAHESPVHDQANIIPAHESPAPVQYSPVQALESPVHDHTSPVPAHESPVHDHVSPVPAHQSPDHDHVSPVPAHQSPDHESPVQHDSTAFSHEYNAEEHESSVPKHENLVSQPTYEDHAVPATASYDVEDNTFLVHERTMESSIPTDPSQIQTGRSSIPAEESTGYTERSEIAASRDSVRAQDSPRSNNMSPTHDNVESPASKVSYHYEQTVVTKVFTNNQSSPTFEKEEYQQSFSPRNPEHESPLPPPESFAHDLESPVPSHQSQELNHDSPVAAPGSPMSHSIHSYIENTVTCAVGSELPYDKDTENEDPTSPSRLQNIVESISEAAMNVVDDIIGHEHPEYVEEVQHEVANEKENVVPGASEEQSDEEPSAFTAHRSSVPSDLHNSSEEEQESPIQTTTFNQFESEPHVSPQSSVQLHITPAPDMVPESDEEPEYAHEAERRMEEEGDDSMSTDSMIIHDSPIEDKMSQSIYVERTESPSEHEHRYEDHIRNVHINEQQILCSEEEGEDIKPHSPKHTVEDKEWTEGNEHVKVHKEEFSDNNGGSFYTQTVTRITTTVNESSSDETNNNDGKNVSSSPPSPSSGTNGHVISGIVHDMEDEVNNVSSL